MWRIIGDQIRVNPSDPRYSASHCFGRYDTESDPPIKVAWASRLNSCPPVGMIVNDADSPASKGRKTVKHFTPRKVSLAGFLASGFTIIAGFGSAFFVVMAFSDNQARDGTIVGIVFGSILLIAVQSLRAPKNPEEKKRKRRWRWPWRRGRKKNLQDRAMWKRRGGQNHHQPFGTSVVAKPSTFVSAPRKPTEP